MGYSGHANESVRAWLEEATVLRSPRVVHAKGSPVILGLGSKRLIGLIVTRGQHVMEDS
jgi:hypothetical protein